MKLVQSTIMIAAVAAVMISCKKENVEAPVPATPAVLKKEAVIKFDGNLVDSTGKTSGVSSGTISYVNDRKGNASSALYLDGASKVIFSNLKLNGKAMTMSAWLKYANGGGGLNFVVHAMNANGGGPALTMISDMPGCAISTPSTNSVMGNSVDNQWHHIAATYDGNDIKLYVDGAFIASTSHPGSMEDGIRNMTIGFFNNSYWKGYIDDLRIYSEVIPVMDIQKLAAQ